MPPPAKAYRIGIDENGLGARLGPLVVTAVQARVSAAGRRWLEAGELARMGGDLRDSKVLASHADSRIGEAWARALLEVIQPGAAPVASPADLFARLTLEGVPHLAERCPSQARGQCWETHGERFHASDALVERVRGRAHALGSLGVSVERVRSSIVCTARLNEARAEGRSRFVADLHAMESLVLCLREEIGEDVVAICGKVGGIGDYPRYFGPLAGLLHTVLGAERAHAAYAFPGLGEVHFVMDADASDPLVMLASLVGKYVRELFVGRIGRFFLGADTERGALPSGYHDPRTDRFVVGTTSLRELRAMPAACFERDR